MCICALALWQADRWCSRGGRSCCHAVCLSGQRHDNSCSLTPLPTARMVAAAISAPWPVSSQHAAHFWDLSRAPRRYSGLNSGNWFVNILKRGSAADFKPVILHFQRICCSCWTADYCTYRNHLPAVSCCGKVATFQSWINSYYPRSNCFIDIVTRKLKHPEELLLY